MDIQKLKQAFKYPDRISPYIKWRLRRKKQDWRDLRRMMSQEGIQHNLKKNPNIVLGYHCVGGEGFSPISTKSFRSDIHSITNDYEVVDLPEMFTQDNQTKVSLTFDDGYESFYTNVFPILQEFNVPATVFVIGKSLIQEDFEHSKSDSYKREYLNKKQLHELAQSDLVTIGNHTMTHPNLGTINDLDLLEKEINKSQKIIENEIGGPIDRFSYPYGVWTQKSRSIVQKNHNFAVEGGTKFKYVTGATDKYYIPRFFYKSYPKLLK